VREYATGTYGASAYFWSKLSTELPLSFITSLLAFLITYWMLDLHGPFILHVLITWLIGLAASSTALLFGCVAANAQARCPAVIAGLVLRSVTPFRSLPHATAHLLFIFSHP
jgi:ABC-type multidrug transport system permease subunit